MQTATVRAGDRPGASNDLDWMIVSRNAALMKDPRIMAVARAGRPATDRRVLWTDDHTSLLQVLRPFLAP
jgi:hypothetical protein